MVTEVLKPIALRPVVTSSLVNAEISTGVSTHLHVETTEFVSRDNNCDCGAGFEAVSISNDEKCDEINMCVDRNGHGSCSPNTYNGLINGFSCSCPTGYKLGVGEHGEVDFLGRARIKILLARINLTKMFFDCFFRFFF